MIEHPSLETATSGSIRFNTDSSKLEIYNGEAWWEIDATSPEQQTGGTRGFFHGGLNPSLTDTINHVYYIVFHVWHRVTLDTIVF